MKTSAMGIDYEFKNKQLLKVALTHKSFCEGENSKAEDNERLEFLGDAILSVVVTEHIYSEYSKMTEGQLSQLRAQVISLAALADVAKRLNLGIHIHLGKGEEMTGGREKSSILGRAVEALIAAVYLDGGVQSIRPLILEWFEGQIKNAGLAPGITDYKSRLQELANQKSLGEPCYEISSEGPEHHKTFFAVVNISEKEWGNGEGFNKKEAEQSAARMAYETMEGNLG